MIDTRTYRGNDSDELATKARRLERAAHLRAMLLIFPLLIFLLVAFVVPIGEMLFRSVDNTAPCQVIPKTCAALDKWNGKGLPSESVYAKFAQELSQSFKDYHIDRLGMRLNYEQSGMLSMVHSAGREIGTVSHGPYKAAFCRINEQWCSRATWMMIKQAVVPYTTAYFLHAFDYRRDANGDIVPQPSYLRIYVKIFERTFWVGFLVTIICLSLGYPVAYLLAEVSPRWRNRLLLIVLLAFWTSLLVRTTAWIVLLQSHGVIIDFLVALGLVADDDRPTLVFNEVGTVIAMTHVLLPFMILPMYSVMRTISPIYQRAAESLGAHPINAFFRVYLPLSLPGVGAGSLLVFILSVGYYITPALVGGESGQLISNLIAYHMQSSLNWGLASALSTILLVAVVILYWLYNEFVGLETTRLG